MAGGIDQTLAGKVLALLTTNSGGPSVSGTVKVKLCTTIGSDTSAGTELSSSGYTTGGQVAAGWSSPSAGATNLTTTALSWTAGASWTLESVELVDTTGSPVRLFWAPLTGQPISVASSNVFTIPTGVSGLVVTLS
jgi:hypothetical protein